MPRSKIHVGLEIGTSKICMVVGEVKSDGSVKILGVGQSKSVGVRKGEIYDFPQVRACLKDALVKAEDASDVEIGSVYDTYLASILIGAGDGERRHGLADVVQFFLQRTLDKSEQVSDWGAAELTASQIEYAAKDAAIMPEVYRKLSERISQDELDAAMRLENDCIVPVAEMEINGVYLDRGRWEEQLSAVKKRQAGFAHELSDMLSAGVAQATLFGRAEINLDSPDQVHNALENLGIPVPNSTRAWELEPLAEQYPVIKKLLEYRKEAKSSSSFGTNILEFIDANTKRIHADFRQIGAPTGRFSCSNPNLQQIPHETEYRRCFKAPEGKKLVIADYSQIELRIIADLSEEILAELQTFGPEDFDGKPISAEVGVPREQIEELIAAYEEEDEWRDALRRFGSEGPPSGEAEDNATLTREIAAVGGNDERGAAKEIEQALVGRAA